ncbi:MAG: YbaB/EbfC family nucleoid-associated protein [Clostridia bacterium]|nr:YbaB/EbfC family nucleoid-associated protein [Clostridia bacterium]
MNNFRGGFGGNMQQIMQQARKMQEDLQKAQDNLAQQSVTASAGGGMVEVTMSGKKLLTGVKLKREAVDPDDVEMLEDLIVAAYNEALKKAEALEAEIMGPYSNMLGGLM